MPIKSITTEFAGEVGVSPRLVRIVTSDSVAQVTALDYLLPLEQQGYTFYPGDLCAITFTNVTVPFSTWYTLSKVGIDIILYPISALGNVITPVTDGDFAVYYGINGVTNDRGYAPTNPALTKVVMASGAFIAKNILIAADTVGTSKDAGARIISGTSSVWGGGTTTNAFSITGLSAASGGSTIIRTSTNLVWIISAVPSTDTLTVTFNSDPGAGTTVDYIYTTNPLT